MRGTQQVSDPRLMKLVIWGAKGVGKSALIVRFLTKRFIGEYLSGREITYQQEVNLSGEWITAEICDALPCMSLQKYLSNMTSHPDAYVIVFSVSDRSSFDHACSLLREIRGYYNEIGDEKIIPLVLVGNKSDLDHLREVKYVEGAEMADTVTACTFAETSAAESYQEADELFKGVFRLVRTNNITTARAKEGIRSRRPSLKEVALMIKDHYKRQQHSGGNSDIWGRRKGESLFKRHQNLSSKCNSVGTLSELGSAPSSPKSQTHSINKGLGNVHLADNGDYLSADEVSSQDDEFCQLNSSFQRTTSLRKSSHFKRKTSQSSAHTMTRERKTSLNKKNLTVTLKSDGEGPEKELPVNRPPQSAPILTSPSGSRFRFFPNMHIDEKQSWNGNSPISPLLKRGKSPHHPQQVKQKSPTQNILRHFFKTSSSTRHLGSTSSLLSCPSISITEDQIEDVDSSDEQAPIYFRASSSSLSSILSTEAEGVTCSAPTSPKIGPAKEKTRRSSFREVVSEMMKKKR